MAAYRYVVTGRVQGVGFRDSAAQAALALGVHGWVRNRRDGAVEALAQGDADAVDRFVEWCRKGPPSAIVRNVDTSDVPVEPDLRDFSWRPSV